MIVQSLLATERLLKCIKILWGRTEGTSVRDQRFEVVNAAQKNSTLLLTLLRKAGY
ncbi:hypothetical protein D3C71_2005820 [compost metagenome]